MGVYVMTYFEAVNRINMLYSSRFFKLYFSHMMGWCAVYSSFASSRISAYTSFVRHFIFRAMYKVEKPAYQCYKCYCDYYLHCLPIKLKLCLKLQFDFLLLLSFNQKRSSLLELSILCLHMHYRVGGAWHNSECEDTRTSLNIAFLNNQTLKHSPV